MNDIVYLFVVWGFGFAMGLAIGVSANLIKHELRISKLQKQIRLMRKEKSYIYRQWLREHDTSINIFTPLKPRD